MVITPGINNLEFDYSNGIKYFTLVAEEVKLELIKGLYVKAWGYNESVPGPTIIVDPGDNVCIRVINKLPQRTSVHWHGLEVPNNMDGVPPIEDSPYIEPNEYFDYKFKINNPPGTYMYHSHVDVMVQDNAGLLGGIIVNDPKDNKRKHYKDYLILLQEWAVDKLPWADINPGVYDLTFKMPEFNFFTMNGKCYPETKPIPVEYGDTVRVRFGNIQMHHHPIHLHGHQFKVVGADGFPIRRKT